MKKIVKSVFLAACFFSMYLSQAQTEPDLVLYLPFSGNTTDASGLGNNGTAFNGATLGIDRYGNANSAYKFDGIDDYIVVKDAPSLNPDYISLCAWVRADDIASHSPEILRKCTFSDASNQQYYLRLKDTIHPEGGVQVTPPGTHVNCTYDGGPWNKCLSSTKTPLLEWHFIVATYDGIVLKMYVDGLLASSSVLTNPGPLRKCGANLRIGLGWNNFPNNFKGRIDDVRIYKRALTACEVYRLYKYNTTDQGLIMYLPLNGNADDASKYLNNGTVYGATLTTGVSGLANTAYYFDGVNDYIAVPDAGKLNPDYISLCAWIKAEDVPLHYAEIFRKSKDLDASNEQYYLRLTNSTYPQAAVKVTPSGNTQYCAYDGGASWNSNTSTISASLSTWHFMVSTYDGVALNIYIDGILVSTSTFTKGGPLNKCGAELRIGKGWSQFPSFYKGKIDEVRIYNRALMDCEITELYNAQTISSLRESTSVDDAAYSTEVASTVDFYPNPFDNTIEVMGEINKSYTYQLYTSEGVKVGSGLLNAKIETGTLLPGIYIIQVYDAQNTCIQTKRLVKL